MDIEERQSEIAKLIQSKKRVKALALSQLFDVSVETIRKDLLDLQEQGVLVRVHGGAQIRPVEQESAYERRRAVKAAAKEAIAKKVITMIEEGSTIYLDYGTTTYALAAELFASQRRVRVITNSMPIANLLGESDVIETILLGGIVRRNERSLFGPMAEKALDATYMDIGFFGCAGVHPAAGVTNHHAFEAATSYKAMTHCSTVAVLADSQKLETIAVNRLADLSDIDVLVTDDTPSPELSAALELADVTVTIVKE
ncbi:DeoR/GlpR family DNA-binding transcription regulator [Tessaracoccus caeni]|uniref:DeoR/GlpR family DNA-binding transcription regulator n=1 Tax=Tessaracoccus caeni TaxID=3031239 RepID=UPI0023DA97F1|nr:DeoR/GlpR family DNA-binding transcription regulator [Tessaracoccus caeni]MDF1489331.1 DeoR/GlpR family DNA-binding transcription regulator [Tessaracoccus caeni]